MPAQRYYQAFDIEGYQTRAGFFALRNAFGVGDSIRKFMCIGINRRGYNEEFGGGAEIYLAGHIANKKQPWIASAASPCRPTDTIMQTDKYAERL